jgi:hypothetical protein
MSNHNTRSSVIGVVYATSDVGTGEGRARECVGKATNKQVEEAMAGIRDRTCLSEFHFLELSQPLPGIFCTSCSFLLPSCHPSTSFSSSAASCSLPSTGACDLSARLDVALRCCVVNLLLPPTLQVILHPAVVSPPISLLHHAS